MANSKHKILVTAGSSKVGGAVIKQLVERGWPVRATVRQIDERSKQLERMGVEVVVTDMYDYDGILSALKGVQRAYYVPVMQPYILMSAAAFATAAREVKLEGVVVLGQWLSSPRHKAVMTRQSWLVEQLFLNNPGVPCTILNPGWFADNDLRVITTAAHLGILPIFTGGDSYTAPVSNEDIARVAVEALIDPSRHAGKTYHPTGPKLLTQKEQAEVIGKVLGRKVRAVPVPFWMVSKSARMQGVSPFDQSQLRIYIEDHKQGAFQRGSPSDDVLRVTGSPAEDFETTVKRYLARPENQPTWANWWREFGSFMYTPMAPGYDMDGYVRRMGFPTHKGLRMAIVDEEWKATHQ